MTDITIKTLKIKDLEIIIPLIKQLNPNTAILDLKNRQTEMFKFDNYTCFGLFKENKLIGLSSGWITVRLYSGKQLEIDNVIIDNSIQSKGYGKTFITQMQSWAKNNGCETMELNTYVQNDKSHKFYFNQEFRILGFHFQKDL